MKKIYTALACALAEGTRCGSMQHRIQQRLHPRGAGAKMLVQADRPAVGTIGGGAVEYRAEQLAQTLLAEKRSDFASYRLASGEIADIGMICGGDVRVYFQYFDPAVETFQPCLNEILTLLSGSRAAWTVTAIDADSRWQMGVFSRENGLRYLPDLLNIKDMEPLLGSRGILREGCPTLYVEPLCCAGTVYLFGGGHVGRELAHILAMTDFRVVVWDERPHAAKREIFPDAAEIFCGPYDGAFEKLEPVTEQDYIVIMTPGHQADYTVLSQALRTPAQYIGCIGSRKKVAATREKLLSNGFSSEEIDRVYAPIGLPIGGERPAEIAVSVAAQMIACRSGRLDSMAEGGKYAAN